MPPRPAILVAGLLVALQAAMGARQASLDYPQWRGRDRDGSASGFVEPKVWPDALTRAWKVDVGEGYATPLVIGDRVYVFARVSGEEVLSALDARTGAPLWKSGYPADFTPIPAAARHGNGPKATPLFHEGKIFTVGIAGIVSAFDAASGKRLWQTAGPAEPPIFSAASSLVGDKGIVIGHPGNYGP